MIIAILAVYVAILIVLEKLGVIRWTPFWKFSIFLFWILAQFALIIPMGWFAPQGQALIARNAVQIIPDVSGEVIEVPVEKNKIIKAGDVLFRIDPEPFNDALMALESQFEFAKLRLEQAELLHARDAGRALDVRERQSQVTQLRAQVQNAKWNLQNTIVRAPADGFVTNLQLRKGARAGNAPAMVFIETGQTLAVIGIAQNQARYVKPGQKVEIAMKYAPGRIVTGRVRDLVPALAQGHSAPSGAAISSESVHAAPFVVNIDLDNQDEAAQFPAGSVGTGAIFSDHGQVTHVIRRIMLRQISIIDYINPY